MASPAKKKAPKRVERQFVRIEAILLGSKLVAAYSRDAGRKRSDTVSKRERALRRFYQSTRTPSWMMRPSNTVETGAKVGAEVITPAELTCAVVFRVVIFG